MNNTDKVRDRLTKEQQVHYDILIGLLEGNFLDENDDAVCDIERELDKLINSLYQQGKEVSAEEIKTISEVVMENLEETKVIIDIKHNLIDALEERERQLFASSPTASIESEQGRTIPTINSLWDYDRSLCESLNFKGLKVKEVKDGLVHFYERMAYKGYGVEYFNDGRTFVPHKSYSPDQSKSTNK